MKNLASYSKKWACLALYTLACLYARAQAEAPTPQNDSTASNLLPPVEIVAAALQVADFNAMFLDTASIFVRRLLEFSKTTGYRLEVAGYLSDAEKSHFWISTLKVLFGSESADAASLNAVAIDVGWRIGSQGRWEGRMRQSVSSLSGSIMPEALQMFRDSIDAFHEVGLDSIKNSRAPEHILALLAVLEAGVTGSDKKDAGDFELQLFEGSRRSGKDSTMLITATPAMPDIRAKIASPTAGSYKMKLVVSYLRQCTGNGAGRTPSQVTTFPSSGWHEASAGEEWDIDFGTDAETQRPMIRGGIAYLIAESPSGAKDTLRFFIKGQNPTVQQLNTYLNQAPYNGVWFFKKIIFHESGSSANLSELVRHFNPYSSSNENLSENNWGAYSRMPNFGVPCGWGLGQLDNPAPPAQALWDWQANIRAAYDLLKDKQGDVNEHLGKCAVIVDEWDNPGLPIVVQPDRVEGGITYTHASSPHFTHAINAHFGSLPANNHHRSFIEACWIKLYNGRGAYDYYYIVRGRTKEDPPKWLICDYATWQRRNPDGTTTPMYNYYVRDIGNRKTP
jgi:hypothetical protein